MKLKILFVAQEIMPYLPETGISHLCRYLPQGIQERGWEIRAFMPRFGCINERRNQLHEVIRLSGMNLIIDDTDHPLVIKVASIQPARMQVYFIDNEDFFSRKFTFSEKGNEFDDNDERAIFFTRGVIETVKKLGWAPDVIHCHGWFTSLIPFYMRNIYAQDPLFENNNYKVVYSVYDDYFTKPLTGLAKRLNDEAKFDSEPNLPTEGSWESLTKFAIDNADGIIYGAKDLNPNIKDYVENGNKHFLKYQDEDSYIDRYNDFYKKLLGTNL